MAADPDPVRMHFAAGRALDFESVVVRAVWRVDGLEVRHARDLMSEALHGELWSHPFRSAVRARAYIFLIFEGVVWARGLLGGFFGVESFSRFLRSR